MAAPLNLASIKDLVAFYASVDDKKFKQWCSELKNLIESHEAALAELDVAKDVRRALNQAESDRRQAAAILAKANTDASQIVTDATAEAQKIKGDAEAEIVATRAQLKTRSGELSKAQAEAERAADAAADAQTAADDAMVRANGLLDQVTERQRDVDEKLAVLEGRLQAVS